MRTVAEYLGLRRTENSRSFAELPFRLKLVFATTSCAVAGALGHLLH